MYATDRQTDGRTKAKHTAPFPTGGGIIKYECQYEYRHDEKLSELTDNDSEIMSNYKNKPISI